MNRSSFISLSKVVAALVLSAALYVACTPKKISSNSGDGKVYNDDSEITMKATEKNSKMPFDTSGSIPKTKSLQMKYETQ